MFAKVKGGFMVTISNRMGRILWMDDARATLDGADLTGANLTRANLIRANLTGAPLDGADLTRANLIRATLTGATLDGADLTGANLDGANLTRANLTRANLTGANIDYVSWPLWCGSLGVKIDARIAAQLLYHALAPAVSCGHLSAGATIENLIDFVNANFHRVESGSVPPLKMGDK
jgi:uncharacterized protein YjbI with pentapeptide repeats